MRLYSRDGVTSVAHPDFGEFHADADGAIDFPDELGTHLHRVAVGGVRQWEDDAERSNRLAAEELKRRQDPSTLLAAVEDLIAAQQSAAEPAPKPRTRKATAAKPS